MRMAAEVTVESEEKTDLIKSLTQIMGQSKSLQNSQSSSVEHEGVNEPNRQLTQQQCSATSISNSLESSEGIQKPKQEEKRHHEDCVDVRTDDTLSESLLNEPIEGKQKMEKLEQENSLLNKRIKSMESETFRCEAPVNELEQNNRTIMAEEQNEVQEKPKLTDAQLGDSKLSELQELRDQRLSQEDDSCKESNSTKTSIPQDGNESGFRELQAPTSLSFSQESETRVKPQSPPTNVFHDRLTKAIYSDEHQTQPPADDSKSQLKQLSQEKADLEASKLQLQTELDRLREENHQIKSWQTQRKKQCDEYKEAIKNQRTELENKQRSLEEFKQICQNQKIHLAEYKRQAEEDHSLMLNMKGTIGELIKRLEQHADEFDSKLMEEKRKQERLYKKLCEQSELRLKAEQRSAQLNASVEKLRRELAETWQLKESTV
ncbi:hypothetical protein BOX15_Mlig020877g1 [Macrostomum lignano]|uniref:Uncharacterized protein n=1 Tax=Macrostomum lignano TaxID=282301 RepID=A0A267GBL6_9PLAT|nr:hypothetical protein BOX15_Mlig020877g1 [Macrostomum lignano]